MNIILDACAVISFFRDEEGGDIVEEFLIRPDCNSYIHAINLCEVYSDFIRSNNQFMQISNLFCMVMAIRYWADYC